MNASQIFEQQKRELEQAIAQENAERDAARLERIIHVHNAFLAATKRAGVNADLHSTSSPASIQMPAKNIASASTISHAFICASP